MSDTETPTHDGEPQHTTEGLEVIENLRTFNEGDEVTIRTDEELFTGRIEWIDASEHEHVVSIDVSDSEQIRQHTDRDDIRLHIFASGGLGDGWFVPAALVRVGHIDSCDLGRVRSVSRPDDSDDELDSDDTNEGRKSKNVLDELDKM